MVALKGKLGLRPPVIKLGGSSIKYGTQAVVLGVTIDGSRSFAPHARSIGERAAKCFGKMSRVSTASWGIRYRALRILYRGTFVATVTYAAACWAERASLHVVRSLLLKAQRGPLILLTKAYRTVSTSALAVLAGVLPADLEVIRAGKTDLARESATKRELSSLRRGIWAEVETMWQQRWASDERGSHLRRFFPTVEGRLRATWVEPDYATSQLLTGHGCFRWRLHGFRLCESSVCDCGEGEEDAHHVIWECKLYEDLRCKMLSRIELAEVGPVYYRDLVATEANFRGLLEFAHSWQRRRSVVEEVRPARGHGREVEEWEEV
ncbi:jg27626 [Pararge aegeria aegeria]|uniref:Jg27626 protein n=1 Tax=Pararge aegeria aegeria TaxID=348720 RepID=A0A8S4QQH2_9NEOP|nr:jg27626 [Pararge aegeria aegeria]